MLEDNGMLPSLIERLAGAPVRLEEMASSIPGQALIFKKDGKWSVKEEAGHLSDLEPLWLGRLEDLINAEAELRMTDLTNQLTHQANHNATSLETLLKRFRENRTKLVLRLDQVSDEQLLHVSLHPRLKTPMWIIDLAFFVAEHDDHHLSSIRSGLI